MNKNTETLKKVGKIVLSFVAGLVFPVAFVFLLWQTFLSDLLTSFPFLFPIPILIIPFFIFRKDKILAVMFDIGFIIGSSALAILMLSNLHFNMI